jgi:methylthioribose-1-phosphate isomerase
VNVKGRHYRTIWVGADCCSVEIIDQTLLPHRFAIKRLTTLDEAAHAIRAMLVRGAPLIGATAAYGVCLALRDDPSDRSLKKATATLLATRPTAVNLRWALERMSALLERVDPAERIEAGCHLAMEICEEDVRMNEAIGRNGLEVLRALVARKPKDSRLNILTHCNAGWLATVDWGTALAPVYMAHDAGLPVHVWVDETRPRNQGASLTAWELAAHGVPHTVVADNAGGHLMQHRLVDVCLVGTDRTTARGDVANKIGTYLKALAAHDNGVPFYVALPGPSLDWSLQDGVREIPIEERDAREVTHIRGADARGTVREVRLVPKGTVVANPAFDVTPARLITGFITDRGVCPATREGLARLFKKRR